MLIDARTILADEVIETEVCIVGGGPAGMTLALEFAEQNFQVCLLESGGLEADSATQSLSAGKTTPPYPEIDVTHSRQFGGTANIWHIDIGEGQQGARFIPFNQTDFEQRDGVPYSGWPFQKSHLEPFYERAQTICKLGPYRYDSADWETPETPKLPFDGSRISTIVCQFAPLTGFARDHRQNIKQATNITTYLHANVVEIETTGFPSHVQAVRVATLQGNQFSVSAKIFILASGGFENARLLLLSDRGQPTGLGNQNDLVGRFFMDHPCYFGGLWIPADRQIFNRAGLYDIRRVEGVPIMGRLALSEAVISREKILNVFAFLHPRPKEYRSKAVKSLKMLLTAARRRELPKDVLRHLRNIVGGLDDLGSVAYKRLSKPPAFLSTADKGGWSALANKEKLFATFEVFLSAEQVPDPDNRVILMEECDRLGRRKMQLNWRWQNDTDLHTIKRAQEIFAEEIARAGLGRLEIERDGEIPQLATSSAHHLMGTTRMHCDPKQGVVDENCRVHGIDNLFIAGSSVFPTGGQVNPTLTIVAMAVRLADHIKQAMVLTMSAVE